MMASMSRRCKPEHSAAYVTGDSSADTPVYVRESVLFPREDLSLTRESSVTASSPARAGHAGLYEDERTDPASHDYHPIGAYEPRRIDYDSRQLHELCERFPNTMNRDELIERRQSLATLLAMDGTPPDFTHSVHGYRPQTRERPPLTPSRRDQVVLSNRHNSSQQRKVSPYLDPSSDNVSASCAMGARRINGAREGTANLSRKRRRLPGPVAFLQQEGGKGAGDDTGGSGRGGDEDVAISDGDQDDRRLSEVGVGHFGKGPWLSLCSSVEAPIPERGASASKAMQVFLSGSVSPISEVLAGDFDLKVPVITAVIDVYTRLSQSDIAVELVDPSGRIKGYLHHACVEEHGPDLGPGAAVVLKEVSIFVPGTGVQRLLNVHPDCILGVFPPDTPLPTRARLVELTGLDPPFTPRALDGCHQLPKKSQALESSLSPFTLEPRPLGHADPRHGITRSSEQSHQLRPRRSTQPTSLTSSDGDCSPSQPEPSPSFGTPSKPSSAPCSQLRQTANLAADALISGRNTSVLDSAQRSTRPQEMSRGPETVAAGVARLRPQGSSTDGLPSSTRARGSSRPLQPDNRQAPSRCVSETRELGPHTKDNGQANSGDVDALGRHSATHLGGQKNASENTRGLLTMEAGQAEAGERGRRLEASSAGVRPSTSSPNVVSEEYINLQGRGKEVRDQKDSKCLQSSAFDGSRQSPITSTKNIWSNIDDLHSEESSDDEAGSETFRDQAARDDRHVSGGSTSRATAHVDQEPSAEPRVDSITGTEDDIACRASRGLKSAALRSDRGSPDEISLCSGFGVERGETTRERKESSADLLSSEQARDVVGKGRRASTREGWSFSLLRQNGSDHMGQRRALQDESSDDDCELF